MKELLRKYKIKDIWHFTDKSNLASIEKHGGILSLGELEERGIEIPVPGGNEWSHDADKYKGLDKYVHLAFLDDHPMLYHAKKEGRIPNPIWLRVDPSLLLETGVQFCSNVSNKSGVELFEADEAEDEIDFEVLFTRTNWKEPAIQARRQAAVKTEILIPRQVPIDRIRDYKNG